MHPNIYIHRFQSTRAAGRKCAAISTLAALALTSAVQVRAELLIGLAGANSIFSFDSASPGTTSALLPITGIGSETIFDIDIRPADQLLYGLSNAGKLYSINQTTGVATLSASLVGTSLDPTATRFGIDFNPTVDRLRIVSNTGQDLRLTPGTSLTTVDGNLNGAASGAVSVAYTNNDLNPATGTTLFYVGPNTATTLFTTSDPNAGVLSTVGGLGISSGQNVGFDISGLSGTAFATFSGATGGGSSLYTLNLSTGAATLVAPINAGVLNVRGLAASPALATVPDMGSSALLFLCSLFGLISVKRAYHSFRRSE